MKRFLLILILFNLILKGSSQPSTDGLPKVVISIIVENMRTDYIDRYWKKFGNDGFRKLYTSGRVFSNVRMDQYILNNATGTATLFTGVPPAVHGIIDRQWFDREKGTMISCTGNNNYSVTGVDQKTEGISPSGLQTFTIAEQLKLFSGGKSKVFSIAMNAAPAVLSCGFSGDAAFWFDEGTGHMVTSAFYLKQLPEWAKRFNQQGFARKYSSGKWELLKSPHDYSESLPDNDTLETGYGPGMNTFPHDLKELVKKEGSYSLLKTTPYANTLAKTFCIELLENEAVGTDQYPDLVNLFFSSMDRKLDAFGPMSVEMEDLYLRMDEEIAGVIHYAVKRYGAENLIIVLTSNGSASYNVDYMKQRFRIPVSRFVRENAFALLNAYLSFTYGNLRWIDHFSGSQVYLNHKLIEINKVDLKEIRQKTAGFLTRFEGVRLAVTAEQIEQKQLSDFQLDGIDHSYTPFRSGDVLYMLKEGWQSESTGHSGNYTDQRRIPMVFWGAGITNRTIRTVYKATDFAPTLAAIMKIQQPEKSYGIVMEGF